MSHFSVLVIGENIKEQLAPYQENNMDDAPKEYLKYYGTSIETGDSKYYETEEEARNALGSDFDEEESYWENPNAKWDWWVTGGRWSGFLTDKTGMERDSLNFSLIDFDLMKKQKLESAKKAWAAWEKEEKQDPARGYIFYGIKRDETKEDYLKRNQSIAPFAVVKDGKWYEKGEMGWFACVDNEKTSEDWSGEFEELIKGLAPETLLTIVDCHI